MSFSQETAGFCQQLNLNTLSLAYSSAFCALSSGDKDILKKEMKASAKYRTALPGSIYFPELKVKGSLCLQLLSCDSK